MFIKEQRMVLIMNESIFVILIASSSLVPRIISWQFSFGDCPVFYNEPCSTKFIKFQLSHTENEENQYFSLDPFFPKLPKDFNKDTEIKIVIHGYGGLSVDSATTNVTAAYQREKFNVITVDWEYLAHLPCYVTAFMNTWHVAQCTSVLIVGLLSNGISLKKIQLIGFSLGAHIAGFTGTQIKEITGLKLGRITGLDPALPLFATLDNHWKLDPGDADFVDVVHTSALTFGKFEPSGHVDFYMNGGMIQPFCVSRPHPPLCSHILAGLYFAESISKGRKFIGTECNRKSSNFVLGVCSSKKTANMGQYVNKTSRGIYYVETSDKPPFALDYVGYTYLYYK